MTSAELKTLRESLGLSQSWLQRQAGVNQIRTVQHWESGRNNVPEDVAQLMLSTQAKLEHIVAQTIKFVKSQKAKPQIIDLVRYRTDEELWEAHPDFHPLPATFHAAMLQRTVDELRQLGVEAEITYSDRQ